MEVVLGEAGVEASGVLAEVPRVEVAPAEAGRHCRFSIFDCRLKKVHGELLRF